MRKGDLVFDVGACWGERTDVLLKAGASVIAIEPVVDSAKMLQRRFWFNLLQGRCRKKCKLIIVAQALMEKVGKRPLLISNGYTTSSMSEEWINTVKQSGRFAHINWERREVVPVTTLDQLMEDYGVPVFCKIDVEGSELQVIKGMSKPINSLSFECTPEFMGATIDCIVCLSDLGEYKYNYSLGDTPSLVLSRWVNTGDICKIAQSECADHRHYDIYARLVK